MKKFLTGTFSILIGVLLSLGPAAATVAYAEPSTTDSSTDTFVIDSYDLFNNNEYTTLNTAATNASEQYGVGVYLLIVDDIGSSNVREFATSYYRTNDLGLGPRNSGILFLIAVDSRDYVTITYGAGIDQFSDPRIEDMEEDITGYLSDDRWYDASKCYIDMATETLEYYDEHGSAQQGRADLGDILFVIVASVSTAAAIAGFVCWRHYKQMKTAKEKCEAHDYFDSTTFVLLDQSDHYVTTKVVATPRSDDEKRGGGGSTRSDGFGGSSGGKF